jgi:hypothetical protein
MQQIHGHVSQFTSDAAKEVGRLQQELERQVQVNNSIRGAFFIALLTTVFFFPPMWPFLPLFALYFCESLLCSVAKRLLRTFNNII